MPSRPQPENPQPVQAKAVFQPRLFPTVRQPCLRPLCPRARAGAKPASLRQPRMPCSKAVTPRTRTAFGACNPPRAARNLRPSPQGPSEAPRPAHRPRDRPRRLPHVPCGLRPPRRTRCGRNPHRARFRMQRPPVRTPDSRRNRTSIASIASIAHAAPHPAAADNPPGPTADAGSRRRRTLRSAQSPSTNSSS